MRRDADAARWISSPGEALFNGRVKADVTCYRCHNGDGTGTLRGPTLAERVLELTDEEIVAAIQEGPGFMPSWTSPKASGSIAISPVTTR